MTEKEQDIKNIKEVIADPSTPADVKAVMSEVLAKLEGEVNAKPKATTSKPVTRPKPTERRVKTPAKEVESVSFADWMKGKNIEIKKKTYYWIADDGGADPMVVADTHALVLKILRDIYDQEKAEDPQMKFAKEIKKAIDTGKDNAKKKAVPLPKDKQLVDGYDCDELVRKIKERKAKAKERAKLPKKTEATKNKNKIESVFDNVKERADDKDISKAEIEKLIKETETLLTLLKSKLSALK